MISELSIFAARVADFIAICADDFSSEHRHHPDFAKHLDTEFGGMALMLFTLQYTHNSSYRKLCDARKINPSSVTHWHQIPAAPTSAFKEWELTALPPEARARVFYSSGTTAQIPSRHFHSAESLGVYEASLLAWFAHCIPTPQRLVILTPPPALAPHSSLVHMFETIRRARQAPEASFHGLLGQDAAWVLNFDSVTAALQDSSKSGEPILLLGTAFSFVHLLDHLAEKKLRFELPAGSRAMETGGYKNRSRSLPREQLHALITTGLGIPPAEIVREYGMSELSSQAYDCGDAGNPSPSRYFQFPPWARAQVISPETGREVGDGETGLLRVLDLANVFSVMALQTEDLAIRRGDRFELLGRADAAEPRGCSLMTI